jgi:hypothetical protein
MLVRVRAMPGERIPVIECSSEVMMHFGLADKPVDIELVASKTMNGDPVVPTYFVAQVYKDSQSFSFPILTGEVGFYEDGGEYYTHADPARYKPEEPTWQS